jgi:hypothetical protein
MNCCISQKAFYAQWSRFCSLVECEHPIKFHHAAHFPRSAGLAQAFTERLILCPTAEAAKVCIRKDLPGALSFLLAAQGVQQRLAKGDCQFAQDSPEHQTVFYILAGAVQDYLESLHTQAA